MNTRNIDNARYRLMKGGECGESKFVDITNDRGIETVRNQHGNYDLLISTGYYTDSDPSAPRIYPLRVHIACRDLEQARISTLEACYYFNEWLNIPLDCLEIILTSVGDIVGHAAVGSNYAGKHSLQAGHIIGRSGGDRGGQDKDIGSHCAGENDKTGKNGRNNRGLASTGRQGDGKGSIYIAGGSSNTTGTGVTGTAAAAEMIITVHPVVFGGQPTPLMPALNYHLARQAAEAGASSIDIDVYQRDSFIPLPNSIRGSRHVIDLTMKELLHLDASGISELAKHPRPEDSLVMPRFTPEAAEWFAATCSEFEKKQRQQDKLRKLILQKGWQIPPCIKRLPWADLAKDAALEACRVISGAYSFLGSREDEIWYHILRLARRNAVHDQQRLRAIVTFAVENKMFMGCEHPLLKRFCSAGKCFLAELLQEREEPYLFENFLR